MSTNRDNTNSFRQSASLTRVCGFHTCYSHLHDNLKLFYIHISYTCTFFLILPVMLRQSPCLCRSPMILVHRIPPSHDTPFNKPMYIFIIASPLVKVPAYTTWQTLALWGSKPFVLQYSQVKWNEIQFSGFVGGTS